MKKILKSISILVSLIFCFNFSFSQKTEREISEKKVTITFRNNSLLPRKYTFVSYGPMSNNNTTEGKLLMPYSTFTIKQIEGTELYLADNESVSIVMAGKRITVKPFIIFKEANNDKIIDLRN